MGGESPVVELYDSSGNPLSVQNATVIPASTPGLLFMGSDGTNSRYILVDSSGREIVVGAGTAGTPAGGVITIQGITNGTPVTISGTITSNDDGYVTTSAPSYTNNTFNFLSLDTSGNLRVLANQPTAANLNATATQGPPNTLSNGWPVKVTDGTNTLPTGDVVGRSIFTQISDGTNGPVVVKASSIAPIANDNALTVNISPNRPASYAGSTNGVVTGSNSATATTSIAYIFHAATNTKRIEIYRIVITAGLETGANHDYSIRGAFITAENATPGGSAQTVNPLDRGDAASTITGTTGVFRTGATGAPTRVTGDLISEEMYHNSGVSVQKILFDTHLSGKPIVLRANQAEGFEIRTVGNNNGNLSQAPDISVIMYWMEI